MDLSRQGSAYTNNARDRYEETVAKAFSLLDDDGPKTSFGAPPMGSSAYGQSNTFGFQGQRSNYAGSDLGDSEPGDSVSQIGMQARGYSNPPGRDVPRLGLQN